MRPYTWTEQTRILYKGEVMKTDDMKDYMQLRLSPPRLVATKPPGDGAHHYFE